MMNFQIIVPSCTQSLLLNVIARSQWLMGLLRKVVTWFSKVNVKSVARRSSQGNRVENASVHRRDARSNYRASQSHSEKPHSITASVALRWLFWDWNLCFPFPLGHCHLSLCLFSLLSNCAYRSFTECNWPSSTGEYQGSAASLSRFEPGHIPGNDTRSLENIPKVNVFWKFVDRSVPSFTFSLFFNGVETCWHVNFNHSILKD